MVNEAALTVLTVDLTRSERQSLEVLLPRRLRHPVVLGEEAAVSKPQLILFGADKPEAGQRWRELARRHPGVPAVGLSYKGRRMKGVTVLQRPVRIDVLIETIGHLLDPTASQGEAETRRPQPASRQSSAHALERFDFQSKLVGVLAKAVRRCQEEDRDILVEGMGGFLFLRDGRVFTTVGESSLRSLCVPRLHLRAFSLRAVTTEEAHDFMSQEGGGQLWDQEALLWQVGMWTARGALPDEIGPNARVRLRRWPNVVRLPNPLEVVAISAVLARGAMKVEEVAERAGVHPDAVSGYLTAAHALGLVEQGMSSAGRHPGRSAARRRSPSAWSRGTLSALARRVMERIVGKAA